MMGDANSKKPKEVLQLCTGYLNDGCKNGEFCNNLHVCRNYMLEQCKAGGSCPFEHDLQSEQIRAFLLRKYGLIIKGETRREFKRLFAATISTPKESKDCQEKLMNFLESFSDREKSSRPEKKAEDFPSNAPEGATASRYRRSDVHRSRLSSTTHDTLSTESVYICTYFLGGKCTYDDDKYNHNRHYREPYQWQTLVITEQTGWRDLSKFENNLVEESYQDVNHSVFSSQRDINLNVNLTIMFEKSPMTASVNQSPVHVRRLSTASSVTKSNWEEAFCTEWIWYWLDETNTWKVFSEQNITGIKTGIESATIEQKYLDFECKKAPSKIDFTAGDQKYQLDFKAMQQSNVQHRTCRPVRRRPKFVRMEERRKKSKRHQSQAQLGGVVVPSAWDSAGTQTDMRLVTMTDYSSAEYANIANLFWYTMEDEATIVSIQRIQNLDLWEDFTKMSERMKRNNRGVPILQKQLFHGTQEENTDAICRQNFDWRISGSNVGTLYGKGSYFARDAIFAHRYTRPDAHGNCYVFVVQVLVGVSVKGNSTYVRPPPKNHADPWGDVYDSCVDDINNSQIFVVFEKTQVYPEFLIKYQLKS